MVPFAWMAEYMSLCHAVTDATHGQPQYPDSTFTRDEEAQAMFDSVCTLGCACGGVS